MPFDAPATTVTLPFKSLIELLLSLCGKFVARGLLRCGPRRFLRAGMIYGTREGDHDRPLGSRRIRADTHHPGPEHRCRCPGARLSVPYFCEQSGLSRKGPTNYIRASPGISGWMNRGS